MVQYQITFKIKEGGELGSILLGARNDLLWELMICGRTFLPTPTTLKGNTPDIFLYLFNSKNPY